MTGLFFEDPNVWWQDLVLFPFLVVFSMVIDEFILRRLPMIGMILTSISLVTIPVQWITAQYYDSFSGTAFAILKAYSFIILLVTNNIKRFAIRSPKFDQFLKQLHCSCFSEKNTRIENIIYIFLCLNIAEAIVFESFSSESLNYSYLNWTRFFNIMAGILLIITIPIPPMIANQINFKYGLNVPSMWYYQKPINSNLKYYDIIMDLPNKRDDRYKCCTCCMSYMGIIWLCLYCSWNFLFVMRTYGYQSLGALLHILPPFFRSIINLNFGLWLQSRAHALWIYFALIKFIRYEIFDATENKYPSIIQNGIVLAVWSIANMIIALFYLYLWLIKIKSYKNSIDDDTKSDGKDQPMSKSNSDVEM